MQPSVEPVPSAVNGLDTGLIPARRRPGTGRFQSRVEAGIRPTHREENQMNLYQGTRQGLIVLSTVGLLSLAGACGSETPGDGSVVERAQAGPAPAELDLRGRQLAAARVPESFVQSQYGLRERQLTAARVRESFAQSQLCLRERQLTAAQVPEVFTPAGEPLPTDAACGRPRVSTP